jgi:hypothetical protein
LWRCDPLDGDHAEDDAQVFAVHTDLRDERAGQLSRCGLRILAST